MRVKIEKVIFLDIDGVLNTESYINHFWEFCRLHKLERKESKRDFNAIMRDKYGNLFDPIAVQNLKYIIDNTDADIVISSSWRKSGLEFMQDLWIDRQLCGLVIDITTWNTPNAKPRDLPFAERFERGIEIKDWVEKNKPLSYVILDDDNDMLPEQSDFFIQTNEVYGLTLQDAINAVKILNSCE